MYVKYRDGLTNSVQVREVRHFKVRPQDCEEEDGRTTHGAELCDGLVDRAAFFAQVTVDALAGVMLDSGEEVWRRRHRKRDPAQAVDGFYTEDMPECEGLAWFSSMEAAEKVLDDICEALDYGKQFFDLTLYGEDGQARW